jgi:hypothetical protein
MADKIPKGGELFLVSLGGKIRAMSDQAMQAEPDLLGPGLVVFV